MPHVICFITPQPSPRITSFESRNMSIFFLASQTKPFLPSRASTTHVPQQVSLPFGSQEDFALLQPGIVGPPLAPLAPLSWASELTFTATWAFTVSGSGLGLGLASATNPRIVRTRATVNLILKASEG